MKQCFLIMVVLAILGCGYTSRENEMIGQVKKVVHATPLICPDYIEADISLGVLRQGVGSMSTQDIWVTVKDSTHEKILRQANEIGAIVKIKYDQKRVTICIPNHIVTSVEIVG